jgi:hypothetical protein
MKPPDAIRRELVAQWLARAEEDLGVARHLLAERLPYYTAIGFHAQQAAEKYVKAFLVARARAGVLRFSLLLSTRKKPQKRLSPTGCRRTAFVTVLIEFFAFTSNELELASVFCRFALARAPLLARLQPSPQNLAGAELARPDSTNAQGYFHPRRPRSHDRIRSRTPCRRSERPRAGPAWPRRRPCATGHRRACRCGSAG